ncbi:ABC transporter ATP-binding protein [Halobaculum sp. MBLA0147]|uniref:ABC transporter ATP-binding protein n=1 Tax=Halobaculum sp. MBLA0147 TaxID=3079934 RepID=UPI0035231C97
MSALWRAVQYQPKVVAGTIAASVVAALLEGIGIGFIFPIVELARGSKDLSQTTGVLGVFADVYTALGVPLTLGYLVAGVALILTVRYLMSFLVRWLRGAIQVYYHRHLQRRAFEGSLSAQVGYFDRRGSDDVLNMIVTEAHHASRALRRIVRFVEQGFLTTMYFAVALYMAPVLTLGAGGVFAVITLVFRNLVADGYEIGDQVAETNEQIQTNAQAGVQGIRDVKLFGMESEIADRFNDALDRFAAGMTKHFRNQAAIQNFYQFLTAISVFVLIYVALTFFDLSLGALGVFLFAIFRLGPRLSSMNSLLYQINGDLPHLVRTQRSTDTLEERAEPQTGEEPVPDDIERVEFEDISFAYREENVLDGVSFSFERGDFVAFVGTSGAGKSTLVSLLARLYAPDTGTIRANGTPIEQFDIAEWRSNIAVVRQDPYIFNDTLERNITIGDRDATREEVERVCEIARVTQFLDDLQNGYETNLGDDGVRLSGGQRQRVALARALLKDTDLIVLDEATSDLDTGIEQEVQSAIESMDRDAAILTIAHRLSTVRNADCIYTMEDGQITESGPHETLMSRDGPYAELYTTQH